MLRRMMLVLALLVGALAIAQGPGQAAPLGATAQAGIDPLLKAETSRYYRVYYYRPRYRYRRYYYRPVYYYRRPRYRSYRYYRPRYRVYRYYRRF